MKAMMTETVLPFLKDIMGGQAVIRRRILRTIGIGESAIDAQIHDLMLGANPTVGTAAHTGQADIRVAARADSVDEAEALIDATVAEIQARIGQFIYSTTPDETIEAVVATLMAERQATLALLESTSAGAIAARLSAVLTEPHLLKASWTIDGSNLPTELAQILAGGSSDEQTAQDLATALQQATQATYAVVALGSGQSSEHFYASDPGQTWLAIAGATGVQSMRYPFGGRDEITILRLGHQVFDLVRRALQKE
jgi:nicotinamide-nucleotide amidase